MAKIGAATVNLHELRRAIHRHHRSDERVVDLQQLTSLRVDARAHGETVVMTNGCFDLLHAGHIQYLEQAKALGDWLIVAINNDESVRGLKGDARPIMPIEQRMAMLNSLVAVDYVIAFSESTPETLIKTLSPDILVKGGDYKVHQIAGADHVLAQGGQVKLLPFKSGCSTSSIIEKIKMGV